MMTNRDKIAVVLLNLGGPDSPEAIRPFLANLFNDPDIFHFPAARYTQKIFAWVISSLRANKVKKMYAQIGGGSPILTLTRQQAAGLQQTLPVPFLVLVAMRYWKPFLCETYQYLVQEKIEQVILLPLYPQYSITTTGSGFNEWKRLTANNHFRTTYIHQYYKNQNYINAILENINQALHQFPRSKDGIHILFSAHGIPDRFIGAGDPYQRQIQETVKLVQDKLGNGYQYHLSYQSRVGPVKWIEPYTDKLIIELGREGVKNLLVVPIAFVSDHFETLYEIDILYRCLARSVGIEQFEVMPGLNNSPLFIQALHDVIMEHL